MPFVNNDSICLKLCYITLFLYDQILYIHTIFSINCYKKICVCLRQILCIKLNGYTVYFVFNICVHMQWVFPPRLTFWQSVWKICQRFKILFYYYILEAIGVCHSSYQAMIYVHQIQKTMPTCINHWGMHSSASQW